jgi:hypothetical protein
MKYSYQICGFFLQSDTPLPELDAVDGMAARPDRLIVVELNQVSSDPPRPTGWFMRQNLPGGLPWSARAKTESGYLLQFHELADFVVDRDGRRIRCVSRHPESSDLTVRAILLDHVIPPVIALRGSYVLHAAAVRTGAGVCVFAGDSGAGKSTIAAQLGAVGGDFLTDDCLVIEERDGAMMAQASHPSVKLRDDAIQFLMSGCDSEPVADYTTKRRVRASSLGAALPPEPLPVARLYFLTRDDGETAPASKPLIQRLSPRDTFMKLVKHSIRLDTTDNALLEREFEFTRRLVDSVPAALLSLPDDLSQLRLAHDAITADLALN